MTTRSSASRPFAAIAIDGSDEPPHRAVGRDHEVGRELVAMLAQDAGEARAADLLLALEQEADVQRQRAVLVEERLARPSSGTSIGPLSSVAPRA